MSPTLLIARRELAAYLRSWTGYVINRRDPGARRSHLQQLGHRRRGQALGRGHEPVFFFWSSGWVITASVFISMRLIAEERQTGR